LIVKPAIVDSQTIAIIINSQFIIPIIIKVKPPER